MSFANRSEAHEWRGKNQATLVDLNMEAISMEGISYSETWLCGNGPSFVAGFDDEDRMVVCLPIQHS
jgi:hypothetical protein